MLLPQHYNLQMILTFISPETLWLRKLNVITKQFIFKVMNRRILFKLSQNNYSHTKTAQKPLLRILMETKS